MSSENERVRKIASKLEGEELKSFFNLTNIYVRSRFKPEMSEQELNAIRLDLWQNIDKVLFIINRTDLI